MLFGLLDDPAGGAGGAGEGPTAYAEARVPIVEREFAKAERLAFEKEMPGLYVNDHPLQGLEAALARLTECTIADLRDDDPLVDGGRHDGAVETVGGVVTASVRRYTKRDELMATFALEDPPASVEVFVFPKTMAEIDALLREDAVVVLKDRVDTRGDRVKLICMELFRPVLVVKGAGELRLQLTPSAVTDPMVKRLKAILAEHSGPEPVLLQMGEATLRLPAQFNVHSRRDLVGSLRELLGTAAAVG